MQTVVIQISEEQKEHLADTNNHFGTLLTLSGCTAERIGTTDYYQIKTADPFHFFNLGKMLGKSLVNYKKNK